MMQLKKNYIFYIYAYWFGWDFFWYVWHIDFLSKIVNDQSYFSLRNEMRIKDMELMPCQKIARQINTWWQRASIMRTHSKLITSPYSSLPPDNLEKSCIRSLDFRWYIIQESNSKSFSCLWLLGLVLLHPNNKLNTI